MGPQRNMCAQIKTKERGGCKTRQKKQKGPPITFAALPVRAREQNKMSGRGTSQGKGHTKETRRPSETTNQRCRCLGRKVEGRPPGCTMAPLVGCRVQREKRSEEETQGVRKVSNGGAEGMKNDTAPYRGLRSGAN